MALSTADLIEINQLYARYNTAIDTGDGVISGPNAGPELMEGTFLAGLAEERQVKLGDLTTDRRGRLVVYGGHGVAESWENNPTSGPNLVRNAGWYDDTSDGIVEATDSCDASSMCWAMGSPDMTGECVAFCQGDEGDPVCPPDSECLLCGDFCPPVCIPSCDPLLQDCNEGQGCYWAHDDFNCSLIAAIVNTNGQGGAQSAVDALFD